MRLVGGGGGGDTSVLGQRGANIISDATCWRVNSWKFAVEEIDE
jgi:hypothetical protein